jgi:cyclophilin family peptidyl-prolyl cis-trans isomerase
VCRIVLTSRVVALSASAPPTAAPLFAPMKRFLVVAGVTLAAALGCAHGRYAELSPAALHAVLLDPSAPYWSVPAPPVYDARVETSRGAFVLEIVRALAPRGADRFYRLARAGYYNDSRFSRVVPGFIAQFGVAGDSTLNAIWSKHTFDDDSVKQSNVRGTIAFAMTGPNARTTQLFISLVDNSRLDAQGFAPIGRVAQGMAVVDALYGGYGESSGGGVRAGKQAPLLDGGNAYADREYPKLDRLYRIVVSEKK